MTTVHQFRAAGTCPVDPDVIDIYDVTVETTMVIPVEKILFYAGNFLGKLYMIAAGIAVTYLRRRTFPVEAVAT